MIYDKDGNEKVCALLQPKKQIELPKVKINEDTKEMPKQEPAAIFKELPKDD